MLGPLISFELKRDQFRHLQVYLAISKHQIVGVCVAHSIIKANRLENDDGIDCYSMESYPAK